MRALRPSPGKHRSFFCPQSSAFSAPSQSRESQDVAFSDGLPSRINNVHLGSLCVSSWLSSKFLFVGEWKWVFDSHFSCGDWALISLNKSVLATGGSPRVSCGSVGKRPPSRQTAGTDPDWSTHWGLAPPCLQLEEVSMGAPRMPESGSALSSRPDLPTSSNACICLVACCSSSWCSGLQLTPQFFISLN